MKTKLYTRDGGFVVDVTTLSFKLMPEVIMWGSRTFVRNVFMDTTETYGYTEAFVWTHVEGMLGGAK